VVVVEFSFEAQHKGPFAGHAATAARVTVPGCGAYEYDSAKRQITAGRIYFDMGTLLQIITDSPVDDGKQAEEALQSNERNLSLITNVIPTLIHVLRTDGSVLYVNQAVLGYTGLTLEDVRKEDYRARFFHPEDVERLREERREALTRAVPFENEQRVLGKDPVSPSCERPFRDPLRGPARLFSSMVDVGSPSVGYDQPGENANTAPITNAALR
jgi:PAS domain S-box-containing protein